MVPLLCTITMAVCLLVVGSCDGDNSTPVAPRLEFVSGQWSGTFTLARVKPPDHCVAQILEDFIGLPRPMDVTMRQTGTAVAGTVVTTSTRCDFVGTLTGSRLSASLTQCESLLSPVVCSSGSVVDLTVGRSTVEGGFDATLSHFDGDLKQELLARDEAQTDVLVIVGSVRLARQ